MNYVQKKAPGGAHFLFKAEAARGGVMQAIALMAFFEALT
jgi:hypothetical protein